MANGVTYGINFPFRDSVDGRYLDLSKTPEKELRTDLIHLLLTRKGSRYYLPDFGTRLYEFIFEPLDGDTFDGIRTEIEDSVKKYIPNLTIQNISIEPYDSSQETKGELNPTQFDLPTYAVPGANTEEYTAKIKIEYINSGNAFGSREFVIINL